MAIGIDSAAHKSCLNANGKTIAVLGGGFNNIYPKENIMLFNNILERDGLVISEYSPNEKVKYGNFPARNRIISGLSIGILVVEAAFRSGTSITARFAFEQGRDIFCIPSSIESNKGVGTARLIQNGAKLVTTPNDILEKYSLNTLDEFIVENPIKKLPPIYADTYSCIDKNGSNINIIAKKVGKPIQVVSQELFMLELEGYVEKHPGGFYVQIS